MDNTSVGYIEMVCYTDIYMYKYAGMSPQGDRDPHRYRDDADDVWSSCV